MTDRQCLKHCFLLVLVPMFPSCILQNFIRPISWPQWLVGLKSQVNNIFYILPETPLSRRSGNVDLPVACSRRPTSKASLSVWDLDVVKHVRYCETTQMLVKSYSSIRSWHLNTSWLPVVNVNIELLWKALPLFIIIILLKYTFTIYLKSQRYSCLMVLWLSLCDYIL